MLNTRKYKQKTLKNVKILFKKFVINYLKEVIDF